MHIELTEMLRCPEAHELDVLVLSTGEMLGRMVRSGVVGCPRCKREYPIVKGVVDFTGGGMRDAAPLLPIPHPASRFPKKLRLSRPSSIFPVPGATSCWWVTRRATPPV